MTGGSNDFAVVVVAQGRRLAKLVRADGTMDGYDSAKTVSLYRVDLTGLSGLEALLHRLALRRDCCLVRGAILDAARSQRVRRLCRPDLITGDQPTLAEAAHHWLALDLDSVPVDPSVDPRDLLACARAVTWRLPGVLRNAACLVQATSSHGIKSGARLRLWYWASRPITNPECKALLRGAPVDMTLFTPAQPHYVAAPVFIGMVDPLPTRLATLPGEPVVEVPARNVLLPPAPSASPCPPQASRGELSRHGGGGDAARFAGLLAAVRRAPNGKRHPKLFWAACRAGEMVADGQIGVEEAARLLAQAAMEGGGIDHARAERTARDGIVRGRGEAR